MKKKSESLWKSIVRRAATEPAFRKSLKANPAKALAKAGIKVSKTTEYIVLEQTPDKFYIVLPPLTKEGELSDEMLDAVAGGSGDVIMTLPEEPPGPGGLGGVTMTVPEEPPGPGGG